MIHSSGFIRNQSRRSVTTKINDGVDKVVIYFGFNRSSNRKDIAEYGFELFEDIMYLTEKDIGNISKGFSDRTASNVRIFFRLCRTNLLKVILHSVQDLQRIIRDPTLDVTKEKYHFKENIYAARMRVAICNHNDDE